MKTKKIALINASSRPEGNCKHIENLLKEHLPINSFFLNDYQIGFFDYNNQNKNDDFLPFLEQLLDYQIWILLTPVYWYTMSAQMKIFLDRFSDILKWKREWLINLKDTRWFVISCGSESIEIPGYFNPFRLSASYLNIDYLGDTHVWKDNYLPWDKEVIETINKTIYSVQNLS